MTRPWRLTRRQRVEMEAALASIRADVASIRTLVIRFRSLEVAALSGDVVATVPATRDARVLRARVAIALRAALRADEDARHEEALGRSGYGEDGGNGRDAWWTGWDTGYDEGAEAMSRLLREWPALPRGRVPLALWERQKAP